MLNPFQSRFCLTFCLITLFFTHFATAQDNHAFQWRYSSQTQGSMLAFSALPLADRGGLMAGIVEVDSGSGIYFPFVFRHDCQGMPLWTKVFDQVTETANNADARVLALPNGDFILVANVGFFFSSPYNDIFIARFSADGETMWRYRYGGGMQRYDLAQDAIVTSDGNIVICGNTSSYGSDAGETYYLDQYFLKINADNGQILWSKTVGNPGAVDRAYAIVEDADHNLVSAGSYLQGGTFQADLMKMTADGAVLWLKTFGDATAPHANHAFGLLRAQDGGYLLTGSSTNAKTNYLDYSDFLAIKTDADGVLQWSRLVAGGAPDIFENASNAWQKSTGEFVLSGATASFPSSGFVPNKFALVTLKGDGALSNVKVLNSGGAFYPRVVADPYENSLDVFGYTNWAGYGGNNIVFNPILINLDKNLSVTNCNVIDYTNFSTLLNPPFELGDAPHTDLSGGAILSNVVVEYDFGVDLHKICELNAYTDCAPFSSTESATEPLTVEVSPNPASAKGKIDIHWAAQQPVKRVELYSANGQLMQQFTVPMGAIHMEMQAPAPGFYVLEFFTESGKLTKKLVVQ